MPNRENERKSYALAQNLSNFRILIIDDETDTNSQSFLKGILHGLGASCDTARSGEEALDLVDHNKSYDIYFINRILPGINGIQMTKIVKGKENNPDDVSVIMFSAEELVEEELKKVGVDKFLRMPLTPTAVINSIHDCIFPSNE